MTKSEYMKQWHKRNREKSARYRLKNRDKILKQQRARYRSDPSIREKSYAATKIWKQKNPERYRLIKQKWYAKNRERIVVLARHSRWARIKKNPSHYKSYCQKRSWIIGRLTKMAREDGLWDLLDKEYENGQRSLRQTNAHTTPRPRTGNKLSNGESRPMAIR